MAKIIYKGQTVAGESTFNGLPDKPSINNHELQGANNTSTGLEIMWHGTQDEYDALTTRNNECIYIIQNETKTPVKVDTTTNKKILTTGGIEALEDDDNLTLKHINSTTEMATESGGKYRSTSLKWDAQGHITEGANVVRTYYMGETFIDGTLPNFKTTVDSSFVLETGVVVVLKCTGFSISSTGSNLVSLNVNGTGARNLSWRYQAVSEQLGGIGQYDVLQLMYDGTYWQVIGGIKDKFTTNSDTNYGMAGLVPNCSPSPYNMWLSSYDGWSEAYPPIEKGIENQVYVSTGNGGKWGMKITSGLSDPTGGSDGDIYLKYE